MRLKNIDLNLLVVFEQLFKDRRVSAAAVSLDLSQPAVSSALNRLRRILGDELFVRTARGMLPTPFAEELENKIVDALHTINGALNHEGGFDPATSTHNFTISMADVGEVAFLPRFMAALARVAPHVTITSVRHANNLVEDMATGRIQLAVGALPSLKTNFFRRRLFPQRYVCLFRQGHPLDQGKITAAEFASARHVVVIAPGTGHARMNRILGRAGVHRIVPLQVPHWVSVADILHATDLVATVPEMFAARGAAFFGLKYVFHPIKLPQIDINLYWHARFHKEPANRWLRHFLFQTIAE
ncbi:MAG: LysR family transcriptional regulator [Alphaproteobacteria bacterium]|nr:LysR family transcriptional regulator [Alphaproteobacteria bacterium]